MGTESPRCRVLIVEDEATIARNCVTFFELQGYSVDIAHDGAAAIARLTSDTFDVVVLDLGLPRIDGKRVLDHLRRQLALATPVLILTARDELDSKLTCFSLGADDYLAKPFSLAELEARVAALHRRATGAVVANVASAGALRFDRRTRSVSVQGAPVHLAPRPMRILDCLLRDPGRVVTRSELESLLWPDGDHDSDVLRSQVHLLRRALSDAGYDGLETVHGIGYRLRIEGASKMSLQRRISWALGALVAVFVIAQGVLAYLSLEEQEDTLVDEIVLSETKRLVGRLESGELKVAAGVSEIGLGANLTAWLLAGDNADRSSLPSRLRALTPGPHVIEKDDQTFHIVVAPMLLGTLIVQYDATLNEQRVYRFGIELLIIGALCIGLGAALSIMLARLVVAPFNRLTERFARWAPGESAVTTANGDEEATLLAAFDRVRSGLEGAAARQREFAANVAHELRTPLSAVRTDIELTALSPSLSADERARLSRAMQTIDVAASTLESLHALSAQTPGRSEPVDLHALVDDAWRSLAHDGDERPLHFINEVPTGDTIVSDRHALLTILRNLLRNAVEHAGTATCVVRRDAEGLHITDDGPGIAPADLPFVFERYYRGRFADSPGQPASDRGLGLAIAKQSAEVNGWRLTVESAPESGTCFSLSLTPAAAI